MNNWKAGILGALALALSAGAGPAQTTSTNRVAAKTDWSVFVEDDPTECWVVSAPQETVNTRDGRVVAVTRGEILLWVTYRPGSGVKGEVSFTGGYPFRDGSTVNLQVGDAAFSLFADGEYAWPASEAEDAKILSAFRSGSTAVLTGVSSRGTTTKDTFSLLGISAALEEAEKRCGS
jgi:hypothetical protein